MSAPTPAPNTPATKAQVQAYRFGMRRLENAVATGQSFRRTVGGPRHGLSFLIGVVLGVLGLVGFAVYAKISPEPSIGNAKVVIDSDHGGSFVVRGDRLHPALNLTSALLAAGSSNGGQSSGEPAISKVDTATLVHIAKGQTLGISGAPDNLPSSSSLVSGNWTVCDVSTIDAAKAPNSAPDVSTVAILGHRSVAPRLSGSPAALVQVPGTSQTFVLFGGHRSLVAPGDSAVALAFGLDDVTPRPISTGLLNAIPPGPDLAAPAIENVGTAAPWASRIPIGTVLRADFTSGSRLFVALSKGVEEIPGVVADLIRADHSNEDTIRNVSLSTIKQAPVSTQIDLSPYPTTPLKFFGARQAPELCVNWTGGSRAADYTVFPATSLPISQSSTVPAPPHAAAGTADSVFIKAGHGAVYGEVQGNEKATDGSLFLVTDQGIKYPVVSMKALGFLGLNKTDKIRAASPALLNLLPTGPTLDPAQAAKFLDQKTGN